MTLIELLVAMVIGLGVTLVVASVLVVGENHKRTTTSTNDADQTGAYAFYALSKALRSAGSSLVEGTLVNANLFGCSLTVSSGGTTILPRGGPFPMPFKNNFLTGATNTLVVAPLLIAAGGSDGPNSDAILLMSGSGADGGVSRPIYSAGTASGGGETLPLQTTEGFLNNDLVLLSQNGQSGCLLEEVQSVAPTALTVGTVGTHYYTTGTTTTLASLAGATNTYVTPLGNSGANNVQFELFGVGPNDVLYSYDLLQNQRLVQGSGGDVSQAIADGVVQMNAIYGVATTALPTVFANWANPADVAHKYDIADMLTLPTAPATMATIIAVRVAIVVRGEYYDKTYTAPSTITIFNGLVDGYGTSLQKTINVSSFGTGASNYRYRVFEFTVPLRNMLVLAAGTT
jgi:type IV pilus assembly protein PilW